MISRDKKNLIQFKKKPLEIILEIKSYQNIEITNYSRLKA